MISYNLPAEERDKLRETLSDFVQAGHRLTRIAAQAAGNEETPATWRTLGVLSSSGSMRLGELAAQSRVSQPTMTKLVTGLVATEWIKRVADPDDARAWQIVITEKGSEALVAWRKKLSTAMLPLFDNLSQEEADVLRHAADIISSRIGLNPREL